MEYSIKNAEKSTVQITIEVKDAEWKNCIQDAYVRNKRNYKVEGFRPGKVPFNVVVKQYGIEALFEDSVDYALNKFYPVILEEKKLEVLGRPEVDLQECTEGGFKAELKVPVYPEVEIKGYKGNTLEAVEPEKVTDAMVDAEVEKTREKNCRWIDISDRAVQNNDKVTLDYSGAVNGEKFEGGTAEKQELVIGSGSFIPGFEDALVGAAIGETKDINVTFPADYQSEALAGKEAVFTCTVHEIKVKELPALDDEFAKDLGEYDTLAEYKASVRKNFEDKSAKEAEYKEEESLIDVVLAANEIELPDVLIDEETDRMISELEYRMSSYGLKFDDYLSYTGSSREKLKEEKRDEAARSVKIRVIFEGIIKSEEITVSKEEMEAKLTELAAGSSESVEEFKKKIGEQYFASIMNGMLSDKLFAFLRANNTFEAKKAEKVEKTPKAPKAPKTPKAPE